VQSIHQDQIEAKKAVEAANNRKISFLANRRGVEDRMNSKFFPIPYRRTPRFRISFVIPLVVT
jgi:hypothetical protein